MKFCSECKKGEIYDEPATCKATGTLLVEKWGKVKRVPYRAYLCDGHAQVIGDNGFLDYEHPIENFKTVQIRNK